MLTQKVFSLEVENLVKNKEFTYMDAVIHLCETNNIEISHANTYINKPIKDKLQLEAESLNFLPKTSRLPLWMGMKFIKHI